MSKFSFNSMMMDLDSKMKSNSIFNNLNNKRLLERITGDLDFFKEREMKIQEFTRNNYDETFANMPTTSYLNQTSSTPKSTLNQTSTGSLGLAFNTQTLQTEKEIRKIIEREIEPFIFSAKNDLRLNIENFSKDIADYKHFEAELLSVKELVQENKRLVLVNQEENERKINDSNYKYKAVANQFENLKESMFDFSKKIKTFEKIYDEMQEKFFNLEDLKQKFSQWENLNEKIFKQMEEQFTEKFSSRVKSLEANAESSKSQIIENGINYNNLNYEVKSLQKHFEILETAEKENANLLKELKEKYTFTNSNTDGKFEDLKKSLNTLSDSTRINLKNLAEEIENNKAFQNAPAAHSHRNSHTDKIENLNSTLLELKLKFEKLTGKFNNLEAQVDEISSDFSAKNIEIDEIKKSLKVNEIEIKENEERSVRKFASKSETEKEMNEIKNLFSQKMLNAKDKNYKALNEETRLLRADFDVKFDKVEKEFLKVKEKIEKFKTAEQANSNNNNNNLNISNTSRENNANLNSEGLLDIQKLKSQVEELKKSIGAVKEESNRVKNDLENQKSVNKEFFDKQNNTNDLFEKTLDEFVNHIAGFESDITELKSYKEKNTENLTKINDSFKKVKALFEKVNLLEESQNVLTEEIQEILTNNEEFKSKTEQRFEEIETLLVENIKNKDENESFHFQENTDKDSNKFVETTSPETSTEQLKQEIIRILEDTNKDLSTSIDSLKSKVEENNHQANKQFEELKDQLLKENKRTSEINSSLESFDDKFNKIQSEIASIKNNSSNKEIIDQLNNLSVKITENENMNKLSLDENQSLFAEKIKETEADLEKTKTEISTRINELESKLDNFSNEIKSLDDKNNYSKNKINTNNNINLDDLEEFSNKIDELENQIKLENKRIEETKDKLIAEIEINKTKINEKFNNTDKQSSNLFNYFEKKSNEIITNFEKKNDDIEDSIKLIVKKIEEIEQTNNINKKINSNNSKIVKFNENIEDEINSLEEIRNSKSKIEINDNFECNERILNLTTIEKYDSAPVYHKVNACSVTNLTDKFSLKGSPEQKIEFKSVVKNNHKEKNYLNKSFDLFLNDKIFRSKNTTELIGDLYSYKNNQYNTIPNKKFLKNLEYFKFNPMEFLSKRNQFSEYNKKFICESQKYSNYLELEIKSCDQKLNENERFSFLNKNKAEEQPIKKRFEEEENLQAFEISIEDVKLDDTFSDFEN